MNNTSVRIGIYIIAAGAVLVGVGVLEKIAYENCLGRGESGVIPLCREDQSAPFFLVGLPIKSVGVIILIMGMRNLAILPSSKPQS
ncbi:MAG: hypothetical protein ACREBU_12770 [Nitrososphaera sp.]